MADFDPTTTTPGITASKAKRFEGTYKVVPKVEWTTLLANEFGNPDWATLYPLNEKGQPSAGGILSPRLACKLFHDSIFIIRKGEESPKYIQDRIPEQAYKFFKKKQWRKQFFESMRRVTCRLAAGLGFRPNCVAEDAFVHLVINMLFELGWRRIEEWIEPLPESDRDKDFAKLAKLTNDEVGAMLRGADAATGNNSGGKRSNNSSNASTSQAADIKGWFKCYEANKDHMFDHIIALHPDDTDNWSIVTGSSTISSSSSSASPIKVNYRPRPGNDSQSMSRVSQLSEGDAAAAAAAGAAEGETASLASLAVH